MGLNCGSEATVEKGLAELVASKSLEGSVYKLYCNYLFKWIIFDVEAIERFLCLILMFFFLITHPRVIKYDCNFLWLCCYLYYFMHTFIYIYMCVCVCVCVLIG